MGTMSQINAQCLLGQILSCRVGGGGGVRVHKHHPKAWLARCVLLYCCVPSQTQYLNWQSFSTFSQVRSSDISGPVKKKKKKKVCLPVYLLDSDLLCDLLCE